MVKKSNNPLQLHNNLKKAKLIQDSQRLPIAQGFLLHQKKSNNESSNQQIASMSRSQVLNFSNGTIRTQSRVATEMDNNHNRDNSQERSQSRGESNKERMLLNEIIQGQHPLNGQVMVEVENNIWRSRSLNNHPNKSVQSFLLKHSNQISKEASKQNPVMKMIDEQQNFSNQASSKDLQLDLIQSIQRQKQINIYNKDKQLQQTHKYTIEQVENMSDINGSIASIQKNTDQYNDKKLILDRFKNQSETPPPEVKDGFNLFINKLASKSGIKTKKNKAKNTDIQSSPLNIKRKSKKSQQNYQQDIEIKYGLEDEKQKLEDVVIFQDKNSRNSNIKGKSCQNITENFNISQNQDDGNEKQISDKGTEKIIEEKKNEGNEKMFKNESYPSHVSEQPIQKVTGRINGLPSTAQLSLYNIICSDRSPIRQPVGGGENNCEVQKSQQSSIPIGGNFNDAQSFEKSQQIQIDLSQYNKQSNKCGPDKMDEFEAQLELQAVHEETMIALSDRKNQLSLRSRINFPLGQSANKLTRNTQFVRVNHNSLNKGNLQNSGPLKSFQGLSNSQEKYSINLQKRQSTYMKKRAKLLQKEMNQMLMNNKIRNGDPNLLIMSEEQRKRHQANQFNSCSSLLVDRRPFDNSGVQYDKLTKTVGEYKMYHSKLKGDACLNYNINKNLKMTKILQERISTHQIPIDSLPIKVSVQNRLDQSD